MVSAVVKRSLLRSTGAIAAATLSCSTNLHAATDSVLRPWTLEDIATVPEVTEVRLSVDKEYSYYVVRFGDVERNLQTMELRRVDLKSGSQVTTLAASSIEELRQIPGDGDWSALIDRGDGVQMYRLRNDGSVTPVIVNHQPIKVGFADQALPTLDHIAPKMVGILSYTWSNDGKSLFYSKLRETSSAGKVKFDKAVTVQRDLVRTPLEALVELRVKDATGADHLITTRPSSDRSSFYWGAQAIWADDTVKFRVENVSTSGPYAFQDFSWDLKNHVLREESTPTQSYGVLDVKGVRGGTLSTKGLRATRDLIETYEDGKTYEYGKVGFSIGDPRTAGSWVSRDGQLALSGIRYLDRYRYGLAFFTRKSVREIKLRGSFTKCDFDSDLTLGVCVREGINIVPEFTLVRPREQKMTRLASVSPRHDNLAKLNVVPKQFISKLGFESQANVVLPTNYDKTKAYPAIFVSHGTDADERFARPDIQWHYPVQEWTQRGYVVVLFSEPLRQDGRQEAANNQIEWRKGELSSAELRELIWLSPIYSLEAAVHQLAAEGIIDPRRVGIAGFSRGSQIANIAMTQTKLFKAASSGDGAHLEPFTYPSTPVFDTIFGGSPIGPAIENYKALSPSLRASYVCGAILQQNATPYGAPIDLYTALRKAGVPAQISLYPGEDQATSETHIFHIPNNRITAMRENLAWFDFWLLGRVDPEAPFPDKVEEWKRMAAEQKEGCPSVEN